MNYQKQFYDACEANDLTVIVDLLNNYNIDVHAYNDCGFRWVCVFGHLNIVKYILTKTNMTTKLYKIMCKYFYKNDIIKYNYVIKLYNNKLHSFKILFALYNTINIENTIYFGII